MLDLHLKSIFTPSYQKHICRMLLDKAFSSAVETIHYGYRQEG